MGLAGVSGMGMRQIVSQDWRPFLENLGRERRAWLATLDVNGLIEARDEPLTGISVDHGIEIHVGRQAVMVAEPRAVYVEERDGATQGVDIEDARGAHVRLHFRVAAAPGLLDGLAPTER
jgi:hypothetical protein